MVGRPLLSRVLGSTRTRVAATVTVALSLAASLIALVAMARWRARGVPRFEYWAAPLSEKDYLDLAARKGWQERSFDAGAAGSLRGLERRPRGALSPWILYLPGNSASVLADSQRFLDALVGDEDWGAVVWAYRGFDGSGGKPSPEVLVDDAVAQYEDLLNREGVPARRVHVVGFSLGTAIAMALDVRAVANRRVSAPASLTLLAPMTAVDVSGDRYETLRYVDDVQGPALIVHGAGDDTLPVHGARLLARRFGSRARYVEPSVIGHQALLQSSEAIDAVRAFIRETTR